MSKGIRYEHVEGVLKRYHRAQDSVLEIGCGCAQYRNLFSRYVGSDLPGNAYGKPGDVAVFADGQKLPFKEDSFDLIFAVACFYQIPDSSSALREFRRILRPGGRILLFDYNLKTTRRLKRTERNGVNQNHVWSPFSLSRLVRRSGFRAEIVRDAFDPHPLTPGPIRGIGRRLRFLAGQIKEGWNIVAGEKPE